MLAAHKNVSLPGVVAADAWNASQNKLLTTLSSRTHLQFFGQSSDCDPVPTERAQAAAEMFKRWPTSDLLDRAILRRLRPRVWCDLAAKHSVLHVTVLGASVSAGCGAEAPSVRCLARWSWTRHLQDRLTSLLEEAGLSTRVVVQTWAKNAVDSSYFAQCTGSRFGISANTSVVLIELESALQAAQGPMLTRALLYLRTVLSRVRQVAPQAALGFVGWPSLNGKANEFEMQLANTSILHGIPMDILYATTLIDEVRRGTSASHAARKFYGDNVHPSFLGHVMLGSAAAYMIGMPLLHSATCGNAQAQRNRDDIGRHRRAAEPAAAAYARQQAEVCIGSADQLPIAHAHGWKLHDEGGKKGVKKLGYVSTHIGSTLTLGPLLPGIRCGLFDTSLGYLQSWREDMGALHISCYGCSCVGIPGTWSAGAFPFPGIQAWSYATKGIDFEKNVGSVANASLTVTTRFTLLKQDRECFMNITHRAAARRPNHDAPSRVRVDSLGLEVLDCLLSCHLSHYPVTKHFAAKGRTCALGADRGEAGHVSPACFSNGTMTCSRALQKELADIAVPVDI